MEQDVFDSPIYMNGTKILQLYLGSPCQKWYNFAFRNAWLKLEIILISSLTKVGNPGYQERVEGRRMRPWLSVTLQRILVSILEVQKHNGLLSNFPESVLEKLWTGEGLQAVLELVKTPLEPLKRMQETDSSIQEGSVLVTTIISGNPNNVTDMRLVRQ
jgi:hypothetical protein